MMIQYNILPYFILLMLRCFLNSPWILILLLLAGVIGLKLVTKDKEYEGGKA